MTPSELKSHVEQGQDRFFFTPDTMQFFGDTMSNYGVCSTTISHDLWIDGVYQDKVVETEVWELFRKQPVKHGLSSSAYFDKETFSRIFPKEDNSA